jgi:cytochrome c oxidase assembly protein subunit 15
MNMAPLLELLALGALLAAAPLGWVVWRHRHGRPVDRWRALTWVTLFLTFDLVLFGAFTRLTDSGLGCPDWPGCYGMASPLGARQDIAAAEAAMPHGPVTHGKAWIEMVHRYLATAVGGLILALTVVAWRQRGQARRGHGTDAPVSTGWATATLVWVLVQGAFGALTVTMKLYPAIVTAHLLGGLALLALLAAQAQAFDPRPLMLGPGLRAAVLAVALLAIGQIALGGWVSTNYAVLACPDVPTCQGAWWPVMDGSGFALRRELGHSADGSLLPFPALVGIHFVHRLGALLLLPALGLLAWRLSRQDATRRFAGALAAIAVWQGLTGIGNVVLGWPLAAAVGHTAGAAALVVVMTVLVARSRQPVARTTGRLAAHPA